MARGGIEWVPIDGAPARYRAERLTRGGVSVWCVTLAGRIERDGNDASSMSRVVEALDEAGAALDPPVDVTTLDATRFATSADDACALLTHVFTGMPCCWVHPDAERIDGRRRDVPHAWRLAATRTLAIQRVLGWRRAGGFAIVGSSGTWVLDHRWTARGLVIRELRDGALAREDLWRRNRLVERVVHHHGIGPERIG